MRKKAPFNLDELWKSDVEICHFVADALQSGDIDYILDVLHLACKVRGNDLISEKTGIPRKRLYTVLARDGNPSLSTVMAILQCFGISLTAQHVSSEVWQTNAV